MPRKKSVLTEKQSKLAESILDGKTVAQASRDAGYTQPITAHKALATSHVKEYVDKAREQLSDALQLSRVDIIEGIMDAVGIARLGSDAGSMIRGYSEIAKMLGMYEPEKKIIELTENQMRIKQRYETMSTVELLQLVESRVIEGEATLVQ